jgi:molybdopterin molybdotransferase
VTDLPGIGEALALVLERARPLAAEEVPIGSAAGRVLAVDALALTDLPPFDSSAMDGYAVRAEDTPGRLSVVGQSAAGRPAATGVGDREAITISTGAVVPEGADAVVPIEHAADAGAPGELDVEAVGRGDHIRPRGGDVHAGDLVVAAGELLGPPQVGALAAAGVAVVSCALRPRVAVLATGTELRRPGTPLAPGEIYESNSVLLAAQLAQTGAIVELLESVADDEAATRAAIERGLAADVLVTSGGVSVGPHDLVRGTLAALGAEEVFWRVAVKPGKPIAFAVRDATLVFGLPGNPVSSLVGFELYVRPALRALQGERDPGPRFASGTLSCAARRNRDRDEFLRARRSGDVLEALEGQGSHMIVRAALADALVHIPRGEGDVAQGAQVSYLPI